MRETSSPPENARIRIAADANTCSFIGFHGCNVALSGLAGQRYRFPEGDHPFALGHEERKLNPSASSLRRLLAHTFL